jgi:pimeloyl-ACP methyl ester carboxylesterase
MDSIRKEAWGTLALVLALAASLSGCRMASVYSMPGRRFEMLSERVTPSDWSAQVGDELARRGLSELACRQPDAAFKAIEQGISSEAPPRSFTLLTLAELADRAGRQFAVRAPDEALRWARDAAVYASFCLAEPGPPRSSAVWCLAREIHNRAVLRCLHIAGTNAAATRNDWPARLSQSGIVVCSSVSQWNAMGFDALKPAGDHLVAGLERAGCNGLGVPLVAHRRLDCDAARMWKPYGPHEADFAATAVVHPRGPVVGWRDMPVELMLHNPVREDTLALGDLPYPLSYDLTTPLVRRLGQGSIRSYEYLGVATPALYQRRAGIYAIDPYQPGKIPVLLIHGLWSGPHVWAAMLNTLRSDPVLRARFQFWILLYPSGSSLPVAAQSVRQSLRQIRRTFDPGGTDSALDQMVVLGKSTGGLVAKMLVQSSGQDVWNSVFARPPEQVRASAELGARLHALFFYEPEPYVKRVIFVSTGHRGSQVAKRQLGMRFGVDLIWWNSPSHLEHAELVAANGPQVFQPYLQKRSMSSFDGVEKDSPLLLAIDRRPFVPGLTSHSIIACRRHEPRLEQSSDGFISYVSAHLDGAASERIVTANHQCEAHNEVVAEVRRILMVHLAELP